jgi:regulator of protease activity HflC (stomatin/prohibitin superfamily)
MTKKILIITLLLFVIPLFGCKKVPAGYVGIKVNLLGSSKGVETEELGVGRYFIGINEELYLFPVFTQNYNWTKSPAEGSINDESITFQTEEGLSVSADIGISYSLERDKVNNLFQKYRKGIDEITDVYLRNMVRDAFVVSASKRKVETVYGSGKSDLLLEVEQTVRSQVAEIGINIERIYFIGNLRLPNSVTSALNMKISATQKAQQRENEIREAKANLEISKLKAEADYIRGTALKNNTALLRKKELEVKQEFIKKWNGVLPTHILGSDSSFLIK